MMTNRCWVRIIPVLWFSFAIASADAAPPVKLQSLGRAYVSKPTAANRAALAAYAKTHARSREGALALLTLAVVDVDNGRAAAALDALTAAKPRLSLLPDYVAHYTARALIELDRKSGALAQIEAVIGASPASPLRPAAVLIEASIHNTGNTADAQLAVKLLRTWMADLPQARALLHYARALEFSGDLVAAAIQWQNLWYGLPLSAEASEAGQALERLRQRLGAQYPPAMPPAMLRRASLLINGKHITRAKAELNDMLVALAGEDRDLARVRIGAAQFAAGANSEALRYLSQLSIPASEANAERLYYYLAAARRLDRVDEMQSALEALARHHAKSRWRLQALVSAGNFFLLQNQSAEYEPIYRACADSFPAAPEAAYCHWKVAWVHYLQRRPSAENFLREHVQRFPASLNVPSALYFLGRLAESSGDRGAAKAFYERIALRYPSYFYAGLARDRLKEHAIAAASFSKSAAAFLQAIAFPEAEAPDSFQADEPTVRRIERARLLAAAGLDLQAETELRFGARNDARPQAIAIEIAQLTQRRGATDRGIFHIVALAPRYLNWSPRDAPEAFWKLAFPFPYREPLEKYSRQHKLDSYLVAGLVRQESAFNPRAVSRANAIGLTQIVPSTGRQITRKLKIGYRPGMLSQAVPNLRLGTWYLRNMIDLLDGDTVAALAAYNAGKSRADKWLTWGEFREPAEFIETIPFSETRDYVQIVLRNAAMYRRLYAAAPAALPSASGTSRPKTIGSAGVNSRGTAAVP